MVRNRVRLIIPVVPVDPNSLPEDPAILKQMLMDLTTQLDKTQRLLRQLLEAKSGTRSEQLSADQLRLFAQERNVAELSASKSTQPEAATETQEDDGDLPPGAGREDQDQSRPRGRRPLPPHLKRERIEHDLVEEEKHCGRRDQRTLRIYTGAAQGDRRRLQKVCVRLLGEDGDQAAATDRKERGRSVVISADDCQ